MNHLNDNKKNHCFILEQKVNDLMWMLHSYKINRVMKQNTHIL